MNSHDCKRSGLGWGMMTGYEAGTSRVEKQSQQLKAAVP